VTFPSRQPDGEHPTRRSGVLPGAGRMVIRKEPRHESVLARNRPAPQKDLQGGPYDMARPGVVINC